MMGKQAPALCRSTRSFLTVPFKCVRRNSHATIRQRTASEEVPSLRRRCSNKDTEFPMRRSFAQIFFGVKRRGRARALGLQDNAYQLGDDVAQLGLGKSKHM